MLKPSLRKGHARVENKGRFKSSGVDEEGSVAFFTSSTNFDLSSPFRFQDLRGSNSASRIRIEDGVDHISATCLQKKQSVRGRLRNRETLTLCKVSIGA